MLTTTEKKNLRNLLAMTEDPDTTFSYDELLGFIFGLAMTPCAFTPDEWLPIIFGGHLPKFKSTAQMQKMTRSLLEVYTSSTIDFKNNKLKFPYNIEELQDHQFAALYDWISGFEEAIALREDLWDPEEYPQLSDQKKEELYHSMMTIQGLVDPVDVMDYFEDMPDELFQEAFSGSDLELNDREAHIQVFLLASLPLAIETFQEHARTVEKTLLRRVGKPGSSTPPIPIQSGKGDRPDACSCSGCGDKDKKKAPAPTGSSAKKSNVIQVDFPKHGKKKPTPTADTPGPIYQLKVELQGAKPPIWRRIQVPGNITLDKLHGIIQVCMDWDDLHLHQFLIDRTCYSLPDEDDLWQTSRPKNETQYTLHDLDKKIQPRFQYIYDFGDDWVHQITVEKTLPLEEGKPYPVLITGRRACPPEDIGGIYYYMHVLDVLEDPEDEEYNEVTNRLDMDFFDPAQFDAGDIAEINTILQELFPEDKK